MNKKIKDIVVQMPHEQIGDHLSRVSGMARDLARDIGIRVARSNESIAYSNLVTRIAAELDRLADFYPKSIEGVAWCARNIFEINLVVRQISRESEKMNRWFGQLAGDEKQIIEGFLALAGESHEPEKGVLQARLSAIREITVRHGIEVSGPFNMKNLAKEENLEDEYTGLYKLFSKYVHPSSWLINASADSVQSKEYMNIFLIYSQLHASDSYSRISDWLEAEVFQEA